MLEFILSLICVGILLHNQHKMRWSEDGDSSYLESTEKLKNAYDDALQNKTIIGGKVK